MFPALSLIVSILNTPKLTKFATGDGGCGGIGNGFGGGGGALRKVSYRRPENACVNEITQPTIRRNGSFVRSSDSVNKHKEYEEKQET